MITKLIVYAANRGLLTSTVIIIEAVAVKLTFAKISLLSD